ncbi:MAG: DUF3108 domain-containing protein [Cocleimonas sp.]|nr:DUF3108 domain-containing protein [Cocleimonas sp.]
MRAIKKITLSLGITLLFIAQSVSALPPAFNATYSVHKGSLYLGDMSLSLHYQGRQYYYNKETQAKGFAALVTKAKIKERVSGAFKSEQLIPRQYYFQQSTRKDTRTEQTQFVGQYAKGVYKNKSFNIKLPQRTLDRASLELALANDIRKNKRNLSYNVVERGKLKKYVFRRLGTETINTATGQLLTTKVRVVRAGNQRSTTFWLAKELGYLPAKILHKEKSDLITTVIKQYEK